MPPQPSAAHATRSVESTALPARPKSYEDSDAPIVVVRKAHHATEVSTECTVFYDAVADARGVCAVETEYGVIASGPLTATFADVWLAMKTSLDTTAGSGRQELRWFREKDGTPLRLESEVRRANRFRVSYAKRTRGSSCAIL
eukprot:m51a1_g4568 hypothetical protein (143) ;mRNA; r:137060-137641